MLSHVRLFATPRTVACQAHLSMGLPRQEYQTWLPFPPLEKPPDTGIKPTSLVSPALTGGFFTTVAPGKPLGMHPWTKYRRNFVRGISCVEFGLTIRILTLVFSDSIQESLSGCFNLGPIDIWGFLDLAYLVHSRLFHIILDLYLLGNLVVTAKWKVPRYCQMFHVGGGEVSKLTLVENHWSIHKLALMKWCIRTIKH